ncbi:MAG: GNAT family N-acetyltransferase [Armatimonas sp.]
MSEILTELSPSAFTTANKGNLYNFFRQFEHSPVAEFTQADGLIRWQVPHPHFWFNSLLSSRDATPADSALICEAQTYFRSKNVGSMGLWLEEGVSKESWEALLVPHGFEYKEGPPGMAADLSKLPENVPGVSGLEIKRVDDTESLRPYAHLLTKIFGFPEDTEAATYDLMLGLGLEFPQSFYTAYLDGIPVATSLVYYSAGVAGIYNVGTLPDVRGKGVGTAVTLQPLIDAREREYRVGILQSSPMGFSIYQKLGFEETCRVGCFYCKLT